MENAFEWQIVWKFDWCIGSSKINDHKLHTHTHSMIHLLGNVSNWNENGCSHTSTQPKLLTMCSNVGPAPIDINQIWFLSLRKENRMHLRCGEGKRKTGTERGAWWYNHMKTKRNGIFIDTATRGRRRRRRQQELNRNDEFTCSKINNYIN